MCQNYDVERLQLCNILVVSVSTGSYRDTAMPELHQVTSQSTGKLTNTTDLLPMSTEMLQQPGAAHRDSVSPSKALLVLPGHQLSAE